VLPEITQDQCEATLDAVVQEVLGEAGIDRPPVDAVLLAARLGLTVALDARQGNRARCVRLGPTRGRPGRVTVLLRPEPRPERLQWALAHEIGEHLCYRAFAALGADPRQIDAGARERVANQLAGRLLLPTGWFSADAAAWAWDLSRLKVRYATASHELIARRMLELPPPVIVTIFDQGVLSFRRGNLPPPTPPLSPAERRCWQEVCATARPKRLRRPTQCIQGWPVHEDGWKREILRTEVEPDWDGSEE
jgi:hypothetical protein